MSYRVDRQTDIQTNGQYWKQYHPRYATLCGWSGGNYSQTM